MDTDIDVRCIAPTVCRLLGVEAPDECEVEPVSPIVRDLAIHARLALIVMTSVGIDNFNIHRENAPFISRLFDSNCISMRSVFPIETSSNFASMATGVSSVIHSIRHPQESIIQDTLFDSLRRGGRTSALIAREQSSLNTLLASKADRAIIIPQKIDSLLINAIEQLFEEVLPDFIWIQFLDMDDSQHRFGVNNPSAGKTLARMDTHIMHLYEILKELHFGIILCADHGQHDHTNKEGGVHDGTEHSDSLVPLGWII